MIIDLHTHSSSSDGQYRPSELAQLVRRKGIEMWSLTDHDTIDGIIEASQAAAKIGIHFIPGIEISSQCNQEIHILGYGINVEDSELKEKCVGFQMSRSRRGERIRDYLREKGIAVDLEEVKGYSAGNMLGRPHFARYLIEHGYVKDRKMAFNLYLDTPEFRLKTDRHKPSPEEAINMIHHSGGYAVLAHPGNYHMSKNDLIDLIDRLVSAGIDGMECIYSGHTEEETKWFLDVAVRYGLKTTCGSDFHGEIVKPDIGLGINPWIATVTKTELLY